MNEAQRRILQMLQNGKITAEEAERLLDAVREEKPKGSRARSQSDGWDPTAWMRTGPDVDEEEAIFGRRARTYRVREGAAVIIRQGFGPLTVRGGRSDDVEIDSDSPPMYGVRMDGNRVIITSSFAPLTVLLPDTVHELDIEAKAGPVTLKDLPTSITDLRAHCHLGPLTVKLGPVTEGRYDLRNHVGPIDLIIDPEAGFGLEADGSVLNVDVPLRRGSDDYRRASGRYGDGHARIRVKSGLGPINVRLGGAPVRPDRGEECDEACDEEHVEDRDDDDDYAFDFEDGGEAPEGGSAPDRAEDHRAGRPTQRLEDDDDLPFGLDED